MITQFSADSLPYPTQNVPQRGVCQFLRQAVCMQRSDYRGKQCEFRSEKLGPVMPILKAVSTHQRWPRSKAQYCLVCMFFEA